MGDMSFMEIMTWPFGDILGIPDESDRQKEKAGIRASATSLERQATQADTSARQRLAARRRGSG
ncbi:hypothetical protein LCGC14_1900700, partial [marine sediment metagenome]